MIDYLWPVDGSVYLWTEHDMYKLTLDGGDDNGIGEEVALMIGCDDFERDELCIFTENMSSQ